MLADPLPTDRARLRPVTPDSPATGPLRRVCRARKDRIAHRVAAANPLRAHLRSVFPGALGLFADIDSPISYDRPTTPCRMPPGQASPAWCAGRMAQVSRAVAVRRSFSSVMTISNDDIVRPTCSGVHTAVTAPWVADR